MAELDLDAIEKEIEDGGICHCGDGMRGHTGWEHRATLRPTPAEARTLALVAEVRRLRAEVERARAEEREACAAICDKLATARGVVTSTTATGLAQRIRARGGR